MTHKEIEKWIYDSSLNEGNIEELLTRYLFNELEDGSGVASEIRQFLQAQMDLASLSLVKAASHLHMSDRTLFRRLKKEHVTFQELLNKERMNRPGLIGGCLV